MKLALIFDFDETLVNESTSDFLNQQGIDVEKFWTETVQYLIQQDWDPVPAYMFRMIESTIDKPITKDQLIEFGRHQIQYKKGVKTFISQIHKYVTERYKGTEIDLYIISSGIGEIIRNSEIAKYFKDIWASDFAYDQDGNIAFPKKVLSFTDKTRYLFQISKGMIGENFRKKPYVVNEKYNEESYIIPFKNMIYIGDGLTDVPCFSMIKKQGGTAIAVYDPNNPNAFRNAWRFVKDQRVSNLLSANYTNGSDLYNTIIMAIDNICS
ncbi:MAG: haloacid dehalogenase-like hydrolase [Bacteroidales bacterium]|nr:haloacid dehalogenase-like hydrolase [Bacteroidales bacterium]